MAEHHHVFNNHVFTEDPEQIREKMRRDIAEAQRMFRVRCRKILREAYEEADTLSSAVGTISVEEAYDGWVRTLFELIGREALARQTLTENSPTG